MKEFEADICEYGDPKKPHNFKIDLDNPSGTFEGVGVCKVCGGINKFRFGGGVLRGVTKPDYVDEALTKKSVLVSNDVIPGFISSVKPDSDNHPKIVSHDGKTYHVFFDKAGKVKNFFSDEQLINEFSLMDYSADDVNFKPLTWNDYFMATYKSNFNLLDLRAAEKRALFNAGKANASDLDWLKNNDPVYLKARIKSLKSSLKKPKLDLTGLDKLIDGLSNVDKTGLEKSINDLKKVESEIAGCNDLVNSVSFLFGNAFKDYLVNRLAGINPDTSVPLDFKLEIDKFLASYTADDSLNIEDGDLNDLKRTLSSVLSDKLLKFKIDINDPEKMLSDLSVTVDGKTKKLDATRDIAYNNKIRYYATQLTVEQLRLIRGNSSVPAVDEVVSKFRSLVGPDCTDAAVNNFINYLNEVCHDFGFNNSVSAGELNELTVNLNRVNTFRKLAHKVYPSKSAGYELVDLKNYNEVVLLFNKKPNVASVIQAADNLRTLLARKIGVYPKVDSLEINMPNSSEELIAFIKNYVDVKNINFTKQSETIDALLGKMFKKSDGKVSVADFLSSNRDSLAGLTLDKVLINHISSEISRKNVSWTKRFVYNMAVSYHKLSNKLGTVKAAIVIALDTLLGVRGTNALMAYVDERARSIALGADYNGELPDPIKVKYADMSEQPENVDYWTDAEKAAKDSYDAAIAERDRLTAERGYILDGKDTNGDGIKEAVDSDGDGDYDYGSEVLRAQADALDADYKAGINNGNAKAVFDLTDGYERAFMDVDETGAGTEGLDEEAMFTDPDCPYSINNQYLTEDVEGVGAKGELNPFYDDPNSIDDNWGEYGRGGASDGISDIIDHYSALDLYAEADRLKADADALTDLITGQSNIADQCDKNEDYADGKEGKFNDELGDLLISMGNNTLVMTAAGVLLLAINGYFIGKYWANRKRGPLGPPDLYDSYNLESTVPEKEGYVKLNFKGANDKNI